MNPTLIGLLACAIVGVMFFTWWSTSNSKWQRVVYISTRLNSPNAESLVISFDKQGNCRWNWILHGEGREVEGHCFTNVSSQGTDELLESPDTINESTSNNEFAITVVEGSIIRHTYLRYASLSSIAESNNGRWLAKITSSTEFSRNVDMTSRFKGLGNPHYMRATGTFREDASKKWDNDQTPTVGEILELEKQND